jgi:flavin reductase (DIM6/NTAB) family NADH-FMN oxidoreductase RutF
MIDTHINPILGRVPSGIYILTVARNGDATGMLASWVMQAGFKPPMITVAVNLSRDVCELLTAGRPFVINVVGAEGKSLLKHFARGFEPDEPAFEGLRIDSRPHGAPVLADAIGHLECEPLSHLDSEDHRIFLAKVVGGQPPREEPPMVHIRKSGGRY